MIQKEIFYNYLKLGLSVIPCGKNKKALVKWEEYQKRLPTTEEVDKWYESFKYIHALSVVTGSISKVCIIDLDINSIQLINYINSIILINYSELKEKIITKTPRGGFHWWFKSPEICPENAAGIVEHLDFRGEGGYALLPPSIAWDSDLLKQDIKKEGKYTFEVNGKLTDNLKNLPILPQKFIDLMSTKKHNLSTASHERPQMSTDFFTDGNRDNHLFLTAMCLLDGKAPEQLARTVIHKLAISCGFSEEEAQVKVDSACKRELRKHLNLAEEVREWVMNTNGSFLSTDVHRCLQLSTRQEMKNVSEILRRLSEQRVIEKDKKQNGKWRKIDTSEEIMDLDAELPEPISVWLPCNLHQLCGLNPKNIVIFAGVSNTGKTAWLLNTARKNKDVIYFNSEMDDYELQDKLKNFPGGKDEFKHVKFIRRDDNFSDLIRPDAINIIDYLEIYENHYEISKFINQIYLKLNKGIAIIAIQKDPKKDFGVGGSGTLHKSRLYVNFDEGKDYNTAKIIKAKKWGGDGLSINPNYLELRYWVNHKGTCVQAKSEWLKDNKGVYPSGEEFKEWEEKNVEM